MEADIKERVSRLESILSQFVSSIAAPDTCIPNPALKVLENRVERACNLLAQCDPILTYVITNKQVPAAERGCVKTLYSDMRSFLVECGWIFPKIPKGGC